MTDVLHRAHMTPTQQASLSHRMRFLANLKARAWVPPVAILPPVRDDIAFGPVMPEPLTVDDIAFGPAVCEPIDIEPLERRCPPIEAIVSATARYFGISRIEIKSSRRNVQIVRPRQVAIYMALRLTGRSLPDVGRRMGGLDHTTCIHADRRVFGDILSGNREVIDAVDYLFAKFQVAA